VKNMEAVLDLVHRVFPEIPVVLVKLNNATFDQQALLMQVCKVTLPPSYRSAHCTGQ